MKKERKGVSSFEKSRLFAVHVYIGKSMATNSGMIL